ncbi:transglycosylase [Oceanidesulfovibrio indonesiensis]|uniref:peptidoglycan lytic exotransglycosylase n=1 Tax=Oceanidesulfovibrio indonesiensis TaxID=54767 RepID=A0A7M3MJ73_9BACT|nr:MltA domain-containing protein [Oceanidesulfovibrio indonesiensis]TVM19455.1 transglycosylase [Oceanidesulfovibrio indonesiensis]
MTIRNFLFFVLVATVMAGCAAIGYRLPEEPPGLVSNERAEELVRSIDPAAQGFTSWQEYIPAYEASLRYARTRPPTETCFSRPWLRLTWGQLVMTLEELIAALPYADADPAILARHFAWFRIQPGTLLTGYYEPLLRCSLTPRPGYPHPLYGKPPEVDQGAAMPHRDAIDHGDALAGRGLEIAWCDDLTDIFFLHVQGSGRIILPDGAYRNVLYAGTNKHPYVSVGKVLVEEGWSSKEEMSMQKIRALFAEHPERVRGWLAHNPKYIFFRLADDGPFGASGAKLTPYVSVASDRSFIPNGLPMALVAQLPEAPGLEPTVLHGMVTAQDTGTMDGNHLDFFTGFGEKAAARAGTMRDRAAVYFPVSRRALGL